MKDINDGYPPFRLVYAGLGGYMSLLLTRFTGGFPINPVRIV